MKRPVRIVKTEYPRGAPTYSLQVRLLGWVGPWVEPKSIGYITTSSHDLDSLMTLIPWYTGEKKSRSVVKL